MNSGAHALARTSEPADPPTPRLHQPWRGYVALGEVVIAAAAVVVGVLCWHRGIVAVVTPTGAGTPPLVSHVLYGNWASGAIGLIVVAGFLVLDAIRETLLAVRTRRRAAPTLLMDDTGAESPSEPSPTASSES